MYVCIHYYVLWRVCLLLGNDSGKHIPAEANERNNRNSIARQRISKHSLRIEAVYSVWSVQSRYKEGFSWEELVVRSWESLVEVEFVWVSFHEMDRVLEMAV
jgi:hypothetical protein